LFFSRFSVGDSCFFPEKKAHVQSKKRVQPDLDVLTSSTNKSFFHILPVDCLDCVMGMLKSSSSSTNPKITDCTPSPFLVNPLRPHDGGMGTPASRHGQANAMNLGDFYWVDCINWVTTMLITG
jgi:hypothetical protein